MRSPSRVLGLLALTLLVLTYVPLRGWDSESYGFVREGSTWSARGSRRSHFQVHVSAPEASQRSEVTSWWVPALGVRNVWLLGLQDHPLVHEVGTQLVDELKVLPFLSEIGFFPEPMQPLDVRRVPDLWVTLDLETIQSRPLPLHHAATVQLIVRVGRSLAPQQGPLLGGPLLEARITWEGSTAGLQSEGARWLPAADALVEALDLANALDERQQHSGAALAPPLREWPTPTPPAPDLADAFQDRGRLVWSGRRAWTAGEALWHFDTPLPMARLEETLLELGFQHDSGSSPGRVTWQRDGEWVTAVGRDQGSTTEEGEAASSAEAPDRFVTRVVEAQRRLDAQALSNWVNEDPLAERARIGLAQVTRTREIQRLLDGAVDEGTFPGAVAVWGSLDATRWVTSGALSGTSDEPPARRSHLYDLASLTKVVSSTTLALLLEQEGSWSLEDRLVEHLPSFAGEDPRRSEVRLHHLLRHTAGLPAWLPLYREHEGRDAVIAAAAGAPLERAPGEKRVYSDLGLILLGAAVERHAGEALADLERRRVFEPLGMVTATRRPLAAGLPAPAPTEARPDGSGFWEGIVHDENARAAGGGTGHAGLFASGVDLALFAREWLRAARDEGRLLESATVARVRDLEGAPWLGWRGVEGRETLLHHTGFTGTALWIDPVRGEYAVLLTNRVHPSREGTGIREVRRRFLGLAVPAGD